MTPRTLAATKASAMSGFVKMYMATSISDAALLMDSMTACWHPFSFPFLILPQERLSDPSAYAGGGREYPALAEHISHGLTAGSDPNLLQLLCSGDECVREVVVFLDDMARLIPAPGAELPQKRILRRPDSDPAFLKEIREDGHSLFS